MFNVIETGLLQQPDLIPDRDRAAYSPRPRLGASCKASGQFFFKHDICELQPPSRFEDATDLQKAGPFVGGKVDDAVRRTPGMVMSSASTGWTIQREPLGPA